MIKRNYFLLLTLTTVVVSLPAMAGSVTGLTTFSAGTPAKASEVNGNFTTVKTAVDDNDNRINANTSAITTLQSGKVSKAGDTMTGGLVVPSITYSTPKTQRQLLAMNDFSCRDPSVASCPGNNDAGRWKATSTGTLSTLILSARLAMPQGAVLSDVWCLFHDQSASNASFRVLQRPITFAGPGWMVLTNAISTASASSSVQTLQASSSPTGNWTTAGLTADNGSKAFFIEVTLPHDAAATLALQGCYYEFTVTQP